MYLVYVGRALRKTLACLLGVSLFFSSEYKLFAYSNDDPSFHYQPSAMADNFRPDFNPNLNPNNFKGFQSFNFPSQLAPDLNLNMWTMRLPAIQVRDLGDSLWTFEKLGSHFNPDLKLFDQYSANIRFSRGGVEAAEPLQMDLGKMKFNPGLLTPQTFRLVFQDGAGNTFTRERSGQKSEVNPKFQQFIQYFQREGVASLRGAFPSPGARAADSADQIGPGQTLARPPDPSKELVLGFKENWTFTDNSGKGNQRSQTEFKVNAIEYDSNLQRFISGYQGQVRDGKESISYEVKCPRDTDGKIQKLDVRIWGKGTSEAQISWTPLEGSDQQKAFALLRANLPIPLLMGPNTAIRLNGVDIPDSAVQVRNDGTLSAKQLGAPQDLMNLAGKGDLGIDVSFSPPSKQNQGNGFSLGNAFQNLWYMVTGRWSEVKGMRQQLTAIRDQKPGEFLLAAGFSDPSFMGIKDLKAALARVDKSDPGLQQKTLPSSPQAVPRQTFGGMLAAGVKNSVLGAAYFAVKGLYTAVSEAGKRTIGAIPEKYNHKLYGYLKGELKTRWEGVKETEFTDKVARYEVKGKETWLKIGVHEKADVQFDQEGLIRGNQFEANANHRRFIIMDGRPVAMIPAEGKPVEPEVRKLLEENHIPLITIPEEFRSILNSNLIFIGANGIGNEEKKGSPSYMRNLIATIGEKFHFGNGIVPGLYNRGPILSFMKNNLRVPEGFVGTIQKIKDVGSDGLEMLMPISIQRDQIAINVKKQVEIMADTGGIGVSPKAVFIGFSGGAHPSLEVANFLGDKASLITLDGPLAKNDASNLRAFTRFQSSMIGSLQNVGKVPKDYEEIKLDSAQKIPGLMNLDNHTIFFDGAANTQKVLDAFLKHAAKGIEIRYDELTFGRN